MSRLAAAVLAVTALGSCVHRPHHAAQSGPPVTEPRAMDVVRHDFTPAPTTSTTTTTTAPVVPATAAPPVRATVAEVVPLEAAEPVPARTIVGRTVWDDLADCESGDGIPGSGTARWDLNTGNGYSGGLQWHPDTWVRAGGTRFAPVAWQATREEQIEIADAWLARTDWAQWPACSRKMGLR